MNLCQFIARNLKRTHERAQLQSLAGPARQVHLQVRHVVQQFHHDELVFAHIQPQNIRQQLTQDILH